MDGHSPEGMLSLPRLSGVQGVACWAADEAGPINAASAIRSRARAQHTLLNEVRNGAAIIVDSWAGWPSEGNVRPPASHDRRLA